MSSSFLIRKDPKGMLLTSAVFVIVALVLRTVVHLLEKPEEQEAANEWWPVAGFLVVGTVALTGLGLMILEGSKTPRLWGRVAPRRSSQGAPGSSKVESGGHVVE